MLMTRSAVSRLLVMLLFAIVASGCGLAAGIFMAGFWAGIIVVVLMVVGIVFLVGKARG
jgi:ABC-type multidrug transport system permease subunit